MTVYFTREHEWIRVEGDTATIGISEHAQEALGDIVFAEVPEAGRKLNKGQEAAIVESVKAASDVYSPAAGEVTEGNQAVADDGLLAADLVERDRQPAAFATVCEPRARHRQVDLAQHLPRALGEALAGRGEAHALRRAGEQLDAQLLLQRLDALR